MVPSLLPLYGCADGRDDYAESIPKKLTLRLAIETLLMNKACVVMRLP